MQFDLLSFFKLLSLASSSSSSARQRQKVYFVKGAFVLKTHFLGRARKASNAMKSIMRRSRGGGGGVCFCVLLLMLMMVMQLENTPCYGYGHLEKISRLFKGSSGSSNYKLPRDHPVKSKGGGGGAGGGGGDDDIFGAEKRKIHTGPNPLHNR